MKYCPKHSQHYYDSIPQCPICKGETMKPATKTKEETIMGTRIITPEFRASYARLLQPGKSLNDDEKYSVSMIFEKGTDLTEMKEAAAEAIAKKFGPDQKTWPKNIRSPFRDGNERDDALYADCMFVNVSSFEKPQVINQQGELLFNADDVYSGMYARASITAFYYDKNGNKGVSFGLNNVMKTRDAERLDGRASADEDFKDLIEDAKTDAKEETVAKDVDVDALFG